MEMLPMPNANGQLKIGNIGTGNILTLATFSVKLGVSYNRHLAAHKVAMERGVGAQGQGISGRGIGLIGNFPAISPH
jgi:hypothetical protein